MVRLRHLLLIPDGSRRHARREYLSDLLRESEARFRSALRGHPHSVVDALRDQLRAAQEQRVLSIPEGADDLVDCGDIAVPPDYLGRSYAAGCHVLDRLLRWLVDTSRVSILSVYGMQTRNLERSDDEVVAFLDAETACANWWIRDATLMARCAFRTVGDQGAFDAHRHRPRVSKSIRAFEEATRRLSNGGRGDTIQVNILAPYDPIWEIRRAVSADGFDPAQLAVPHAVDLVVRTGSRWRSLTSGALPLQAAYSQFALLPQYFPDCSLAEFEGAISTFHWNERDHGH